MAGAGSAAAALAALVLLPWRAGAAPAGASPWARAQTVTVAMVDYDFIPDHLDFHAGVAYRLRFINKSPEWHEFAAPEFARAVALRDPRKLSPDFPVAPGKTRNLYFLAPRSGHFRFWCADHDWAGMVGTITIR